MFLREVADRNSHILVICLLNETVLCSGYSLDPVAEAFLGLCKGYPDFFFHDVVRRAICWVESIMRTPVRVHLIYAP